jgi:hypothetical protein
VGCRWVEVLRSWERVEGLEDVREGGWYANQQYLARRWPHL